MEPKRFLLRGHNSTSTTTSPLEKKMSRKQVLEKKKAVEEIILAAYAVKDHLSSFPSYRHYNRNGLSVFLEPRSGDRLSSPMKRYIQNLLKVNMEGPYGTEWPTEEKVKRRQMVASEARYIFLRDDLSAGINGTSAKADGKITYTIWRGDGNPIVGFVQYRFLLEEDIPVLYVYELQLESHVQGKGLGKFLMQLIELVACKVLRLTFLDLLQNRMGAVMLTVQKANILAMDFYLCKLGYRISAISPSRVDPLMGVEKNYEILCKAFDREARIKLEESNHTEDE